jgi:hypothetical protein
MKFNPKIVISIAILFALVVIFLIFVLSSTKNEMSEAKLFEITHKVSFNNQSSYSPFEDVVGFTQWILVLVLLVILFARVARLRE